MIREDLVRHLTNLSQEEKELRCMEQIILRI